MSLTHRIANFFSDPTAATPDPVARSLHNDGHSEELRPLPDFNALPHSFKDISMTPDDELEARPPISHVGVF
jgi:hypothetical protein